MYQFAINPSTLSTNPHLPRLLEALKETTNQGVKVYFTYVPAGSAAGVRFAFVTTSKEIQLHLSRLSQAAQIALGNLLSAEFLQQKEMTQLLLYTPLVNMLVTKSQPNRHEVVYTLSPAGRSPD